MNGKKKYKFLQEKIFITHPEECAKGYVMIFQLDDDYEPIGNIMMVELPDRYILAMKTEIILN